MADRQVSVPDRPLRVLRVIARMNVGGPALQVVALQRGLDPARYETRLVVGTVGAGEADYLALRAPDVSATVIPGLGRRINVRGEPLALGALARLIRDFRPDIVHTHTAKAGVLGRIAARCGRVPITVHTFHGHLLHGYFRPSIRRGIVLVEGRLARRTTALVAVGSQVRDDLVAAGIGRREQFTVVPPGVAVPMHDRADARAALGLPAHGEVITFVARLTAVKRPERFLEMAALVAQEHPSACFVIVGEGPYLERLRTQARPMGERVRFLGWRGDVDMVYAASDLVVLTSVNEGMPVSLIEAAAAGRPVVSTNVGSVAEVVEHGVSGLLVTEDVKAIAAAVSRLLGDETLRIRMGDAAARLAEERFGQGRLVNDIDELYQRLAGALSTR